jgi:hypothetical protein
MRLGRRPGGGFRESTLNPIILTGDLLQLIATSLKRRAILNRYRRVVKRQRADEANISSPHIMHFGLKAKPRFAPDM